MDYQPWDTSLVSSGEKRLADFARALILTRSKMTSSFQLGDSKKLDSRASTEFRIHVLIGQEKRFEEIGKCELRATPRIQVGNRNSKGFNYRGRFFEEKYGTKR